MWQILVSLALAGWLTLAQDDDFYQNSNCRGQSTAHSFNGQPGRFASQERDANEQQIEMDLEKCQGSLRAMIIRQWTDDEGIVLQNDEGFIEFHPPGQKEFTRCRYEIHKGTPVPEEVLRFNGTHPAHGESQNVKLIFELVKPIVLLGCELIS